MISSQVTDGSGKKRKPFTADFFLCAFSFLMLLVSSSIGTLAIVGFFAPWLLIVLKQIQKAQRGLVRNWPLLLMPALALVSTVWSNDPAWTLKASAELAATVAVGVFAGDLIKPRVLISSLLSVLILIAVICVLVGLRDGIVGIGRGPALQGIYESKNAFSAVASLLMLVGVAVFLDKGQAGIFRFAAVGTIIFTPALLFMGQSVGAMVAIFLTIMLFQVFRFLSRFGQGARVLMFISVVIVAVGGTVALALAESNPMAILDLLGKDSSLTGRTYLWSRAVQFIAERPLLGVGYSAFWRIGNPRAEDLWFSAHVASGAGFSFHNEYLAMWVELGTLGFALMLGYFAVIARRMGTAALKTMNPEQSFASIIFIFFMLRTPVEVGLFVQFSSSIILICIMWIYLRPVRPVESITAIKSATIMSMPKSAVGVIHKK